MLYTIVWYVLVWYIEAWHITKWYGKIEPGHKCSYEPLVSPLSRVGQAAFGL